MSLTVLLDLDDTLLTTNMYRFLPGYYEQLSKTLSHLGSKRKITTQIQAAVQKMVNNQDPGKTLREVFAENFYPQLGTNETDCQEKLDFFYQCRYPHLKSVTQSRPAATDLVKWCQSEGFVIAIATNPLFPQTAIRQRIEWADLNPKDFVLFTSYHDFHFTKPHLAYYAEVLGRLGWPDTPVVMIGDNLDADLVPVEKLGYETFWINPGEQVNSRKGGHLSDVRTWLDRVKRHPNQALADHPEVSFAILRATPAVIDTWLKTALKASGKENSNLQVEQITNTLKGLIRLENDVYQPLRQKIIANQIDSLPTLDQLNSNAHPDDDFHSIQDPFMCFLQARKQTLIVVDELHRKGLLTSSPNYPQEKAQLLSKFVGLMAKQDRLSLKKLKNLCNYSACE